MQNDGDDDTYRFLEIKILEASKGYRHDSVLFFVLQKF